MVNQTERYVHLGDVRLWTVSQGAGTPVLVFNGGPGCDDYLQPVTDLIADRYRCVRLEPRGCGRSDWDERYDFETMVEDVEGIRRAYGFDRCVLLGHSAGPNVALAYAIRYPDRVLGVIGISGGKFVDDRSWSAAYKEGLATVGEDLGGKIFHSDAEVNRVGNLTFREYCRRPSMFRELSSIQVPCAFINAERDIRPNWPTEQLAELIPNARYREVAGAAHSIWLTHASELRAELVSALDWIGEHRSSPLSSF